MTNQNHGLCGKPPSEHVHELSVQPLHATNNRQENMYFDEETEDIQSNFLKNSNTWLIIAKNISKLEKQKRQQTRNRRLRNPTQLPATPRRRPATPRRRPNALGRYWHPAPCQVPTPRYTNMVDVRRVAYALRNMQFAAYQDTWPSDHPPAFTDLTSV